MRQKVAASLVVFGIAVLPACSSASSSSSSASSTGTTASTPATSGPVVGPPTQSAPTANAKISVRPATGNRNSRFVVSFIAPDRTGQVGGALRRYQVGANIAQRQGCVAAAGNTVNASSAGARVFTRLIPVGGHWCTGTYKGKIIETTSPRCEPGKVCPAFIGILKVIGTFKFRVEP
jgi:hypothetical protein